MTMNQTIIKKTAENISLCSWCFVYMWEKERDRESESPFNLENKVASSFPTRVNVAASYSKADHLGVSDLNWGTAPSLQLFVAKAQVLTMLKIISSFWKC